MRILQLIDSLDAGGAERMAVNYANTLSDVIGFSALVTTRKEGALKEQLSDKVTFLFLNRKGRIDFGAILKLKQFVKQHSINIIHTHSTSFFTAVLLKLVYPKIKIVWHDHYGKSEFLEDRNTFILRISSIFFQGIISVNLKLKNWSLNNLNCKKVIYLPNFVFFGDANKKLQQTFLEGSNGKRIICLANLREQKNHFMLLKVAEKLKNIRTDWTFHLVGKDFEDSYSNKIKKEIINKKLESHVFVYGSKNDIGNILTQCEIAVLTSSSEGLPVALLEYGFYKKAVLTTDVGEIGSVISNNKNGILTKSNDDYNFTEILISLIDNKSKRIELAGSLHRHIIENYSERAVINKYMSWLNNDK